MVGIDPRDQVYIITFKPKDQRPNQRDDKFEIFRNIVGLGDVRDILDLTRYSGHHITTAIRKTKYTVTDINSYKLPFIIAKLNTDQVNRLRKDPNVQLVEEDNPLDLMVEEMGWGLEDLEVSPVWDPPLQARGGGINVAVIDDGMQPHNDLAPNPKVNQSFTLDDPRVWVPENNHGLGVGGIIAAKIRNDIGVAGVAPDCNLWNLRTSGAGRPEPEPGVPPFVSAAIEALQFCAQNGAHVINQSHATIAFTQAYLMASNACVEGGAISAASAGNTPQRFTTVYPGNFPGVSAITDIGEASRTIVGSFGPYVDFGCPGSWNPSLAQGNSTQIFGGSSCSCPYFAGCAAVCLSAYADNGCPPYVPGATKAQVVLKVLQDTATKSGYSDAGPIGVKDERYGWGVPQLDKAVASLKGVLTSSVMRT